MDEIKELYNKLHLLGPKSEVPDDLQSDLRLLFNTARGDLMSGDGGNNISSTGHGLDLLLAVEALQNAQKRLA